MSLDLEFVNVFVVVAVGEIERLTANICCYIITWLWGWYVKLRDDVYEMVRVLRLVSESDLDLDDVTDKDMDLDLVSDGVDRNQKHDKHKSSWYGAIK